MPSRRLLSQTFLRFPANEEHRSGISRVPGKFINLSHPKPPQRLNILNIRAANPHPPLQGEVAGKAERRDEALTTEHLPEKLRNPVPGLIFLIFRAALTASAGMPRPNPRSRPHR